jgi:hypothetical protein
MKATNLIAALFILAPSAAGAQVAIGTISGSTSYAAVSGYVAYLDLRSKQFTPVVTQLSTTCREAGDGQVSLLPTGMFQKHYDTLLAITANSGPGRDSYVTGSCGVADGLIISDSNLVNPGQTNGPVLYFTSNKRATITSEPVPAKTVRWAVAGSTSTNNDCSDLYQIGTLLVNKGMPGACAIPKSTVVAPRGAVGIDGSGSTLIIAVVAGAEGTSGLTTADSALLMIGLGAVGAVNFDGGGSTTFYWTPSGAQMPTLSAKLADMLHNARFPRGQANPNNLAFSVTLQDPTRELTSDADHRPIYASFGLTYQREP